MPISPTALRLLSALRKSGSKASLHEIPEGYFSDNEEKEAFRWLKRYVEAHKRFPTPTTWHRELRFQTVTTNEPLSYYRDASRKLAIWDKLKDPFAEIRKGMETRDPDAVLELMRTAIRESAVLNQQNSGLVSMADALAIVQADYDIAKRTIGLRGIRTGWEFLDNQTDGWQPADVISVVARTGRGKTSKLLKMAHAAHTDGNKVLFLSMEMAVLQLARRFFGIGSGINPRFLRRGQLGTYAEREMRRQIRQMQNAGVEVPFHWLAGNFKKTIPALKAAIYETEPDIIFADASYLLKPEGKGGAKYSGRRELIADVVEEIGGIAKEFNRPVVQSVQFNRQAVRPVRRAGGDNAEGEEDNGPRNPVAHLTLSGSVKRTLWAKCPPWFWALNVATIRTRMTNGIAAS